MNLWLRAARRLWGLLGPRRRGRWLLPGLHENVEVLSDSHGVPHIFAGSLRDAVFAQGYLHARDRAFQMDFQRRVGQGRLAEVLGSAALPADRFLRKLGLWRRTLQLWPDLPAHVQTMLIAYARGVNLGMRRLRPLENLLLGSRIEPWTGLHSLLWTQVMAFDMGNNWEAEFVRMELVRKLGAEAAQRFHLQHPEDVPSSVGPTVGKALEGLWSEYAAARAVLDESVAWGGGSNAWAVSPQLSRSGHALLASDPHVLAKVPSTWYEVHLETPSMRLYGVSLPGVPGIVLGHNAHLAWGITNSFVDCQDLVLEKLEDGKVQRPTGWTPLRKRPEVIRVRRAPEHLEEVCETDTGPVLFQDHQGLGISLRWSGWSGPDQTLTAWFGLMECSTVPEAQQALRNWSNPSLNFVLADQAGNIGYQLTGRVPVRQNSFGVVPQPGWEERGQWVGWVDPADLPSALNPESGSIVSANHAPQPLDQPPFLGVDFCDGYRAQRITQKLREGSQSLEQFAQLQMDTLSLAALEFLELLRRDGAPAGPEPQLLQELSSWDGRLEASSRAAAVYQVWLLHLVEHAYRSQLPDPLFHQWCGAPVSTLGVLGGQAGRYVSFLLDAWRHEPSPGKGLPSWPELLHSSWQTALEDLGRRLGQDQSSWRWGRLHLFRPSHPLGVLPVLADIFCPPAIELGGDVTTVLQSAVLPQDPYATRGWVPSYRLLVELGSIPRSLSVLPTGQSGWVGASLSTDQQPLWRDGHHHDSLFERRLLELSRPERLILLARK